MNDVDSILADFHAVDFPPKEGDLPGRGEGYVYVICWLESGRDIPFYVGKTDRLRERMEDYESKQFAACTDFRVGEAIRYLREQHKLRIVVRYKESTEPGKKEHALIRDFILSGLRLLNSLPSDNYSERRAQKDEERRTVQKFCDMLMDNQPR